MRTGRHILLLGRTALIWLLVAVGTACACTEQTMLDFIGKLEAPEGYDQVYSGVVVNPPRPVTTMTVQEVLDWQSQASETAVSSAAGRYQVIRATLSNLVDQGVVSTGEVFSAATQDRIGLHLLRGAGYSAGVTSPDVGNRIAGIWAALPQLGGPEAGFSVYEGYAGNHALVSAATYAGILNCEISVIEAAVEMGVVRAGTRLGFNFDQIIAAILEAVEVMAKVIPPTALGLLLTLAVFDIVVGFGRQTIRGEGLTELLQSTGMRILVLCFLAFVITNISAILEMVGNAAATLGEDITGNKGISLAAYARAKSILIFSFSEGAGMLSPDLNGLVYALGLLVTLLTGLMMGLVVLAYARFFFTGVIGVMMAGMGGLTATRHMSRRFVFRVIGEGLRILTLMIALQLGLTLAQTARGSFNGLEAALLITLTDVFALILCWHLPAQTAKLVQG